MAAPCLWLANWCEYVLPTADRNEGLGSTLHLPPASPATVAERIAAISVCITLSAMSSYCRFVRQPMAASRLWPASWCEYVLPTADREEGLGSTLHLPPASPAPVAEHFAAITDCSTLAAVAITS